MTTPFWAQLWVEVKNMYKAFSRIFFTSNAEMLIVIQKKMDIFPVSRTFYSQLQSAVMLNTNISKPTFKGVPNVHTEYDTCVEYNLLGFHRTN